LSYQSIDAALLSKMFLAGAHNLDVKKDWINELNVFPVPDGDTGTNMTMTVMSAVNEVQKLDDITMKTLSKAISSGSLRGARGNSGVILSQLFRGFTKVIKASDAVDNHLIADACVKAVETAYKAVIKPKEGTILTVAKGMADIAVKLADGQQSVEDYVGSIIEYGNQVLARTPEMLPVLKEAGVVDSGGQGLMTILEGAYDALLGKEIDINFEKPEPKKETTVEENIRFAYAEEFIINVDRPMPQAQIDEFRAFLNSLGESIVIVPDVDMVKVHLNTNDPGMVLTKAVSYGPVTSVMICNKKLEESHELIFPDASKLAKEQKKAAAEAAPAKKVGFIAVSVGDGFKEIFDGLGVDYVISGGQTMNPSTEDVLNAIDLVNAENIFLFPNNKNIIMAANQAKELVQEKNIIVIPTKTVPQGITAVLNYAPDATVEENQSTMLEMIQTVRTGEITYAVRDTTIDNVEIHQGDIMAVGDSGIIGVGSDIMEVSAEAVDKMMFDDAALISVYYGQEYSEENANRLAQKISEKYPDIDVEVNAGGQPVYYCVISVE